MTIIEALIRYIVDTDYMRLPQSAIHGAKRCILDCLGVAFAGSRALGVKEAVDLLTELGGKAESRIWMYGQEVPAPHAAFANSVMAHALDYDDSYRPGIVHPTCSVLPAALSICEKLRGKSGKDLLLSVCLGNDIACRLASALKPYDPYDGKLPPWRNSAICGAMGCVVSISKLMHFSEMRIRDALGIVYSQMAGNKQCEMDGATVKRMQPGFMAKAAVFSSLLAEKGVSGAKETFEGTYGFFEVYGNKTLEKREVLEGLGGKYLVEDIGFKLFPCCGLIQAPIEGTLDLKRENGLHSDHIDKIRVTVAPIVKDEVGKEYRVGENPRVDAQFNLSYNVATAMIKGNVTIEDYELEAVTDPVRINYARKVEVLCDTTLKGGFPLTVEVHTRSGHRFAKTLHDRKGDIARPLSDGELCDKFYTCVEYSRDSDKMRDKKNIAEIVLNLERADQLSELIEIL